jgi:hypothetical protein
VKLDDSIDKGRVTYIVKGDPTMAGTREGGGTRGGGT